MEVRSAAGLVAGIQAMEPGRQAAAMRVEDATAACRVAEAEVAAAQAQLQAARSAYNDAIKANNEIAMAINSMLFALADVDAAAFIRERDRLNGGSE